MKSITNQHIFDAINSLRLEIKSDLKDIQKEVALNTNWRNQVTGKLTILFIIIGIGINFTIEWIKDRFIK